MSEQCKRIDSYYFLDDGKIIIGLKHYSMMDMHPNCVVIMSLPYLVPYVTV